MALHTRADSFDGVRTGIRREQLVPTSGMVTELMGIPIAPNKAITGANAFAHSSGIHQDGVLKNRSTFEIVRPEDVGAEGSTLLLTARSGRRALAHRLRVLGYQVADTELDELYGRFLEVADGAKSVSDEDLARIVRAPMDEALPPESHQGVWAEAAVSV